MSRFLFWKRLAYIALFLWFGAVFASIPNEYMANYDIRDDRAKISQLFVEIEANSKLWIEIPTVKFNDLHGYFVRVLPRFPQDYNFKVVYQQCLQLSQDLWTVYDYNKFASFMDNCYKPFSEITSTINTSYTVKANATFSPQSGPAPLTVTFDARMSTDPSNETIPTKNFYWYYRDVSGIDKTIGIGPVLNYTFKDPGNYLVHLTVRSSNFLTQGIFDGEKTLSVDVTPKSAIVTIYANGQKLTKDKKAKVWTQEAQKWIVFDGSATIPMGWRKLISYTWKISSKEGFSFEKAGDGIPSVLKVALPWQGEFKIDLTVLDNENNTLTETYSLLVSDPVAIIKQTPEQGNTSITYAFDANPSYSIVSRLKLYTWEIFDSNGNKTDTFQGKAIKKQFKIPGSYTVKLTVEDEMGQSNIDTVQVFVESTDPIPQFAETPTLNWKLPSQFILDASLSSDIDAVNNVDELIYQWSFSSPNAVQTISTEQNNKIVQVAFNETWKHKVKLTVQDKYGKVSEIEKEIQVDSILRPEIFVAPKAAVRGTNINFVVKTNQPIINYERDFGDSKKVTIQTNKVAHKYDQAGIYTVKLKVYGADGAENELEQLVFVGDNNVPVAAYAVTNKLAMTMRQNDICTETLASWSVVEHPAYRIDRYADFRISMADSVNTKGQKDGLVFYFQPKNAEIYKQTDFLSKFDELGCTYVDVTVEDTKVNVNDKVRIWFKVVNALPTLQNILLAYPQYGNQLGVGFSENNVKDICAGEFDPIIIKVVAQQPVDPDGSIAYFKWYYYFKDDPTRILETKITPKDIPYAFFNIPKIPWELMFGVQMYDNDDGVQSSEEVIGNGPVLFCPPDNKKLDIPIVVLKSDKVSVEVGDEVTFDVVAKIVSDRPDFIQERTIQYDFDGDGTYDLTTKKDHVTYSYAKPNDKWFTPRAAVLYRWYKGIGKWGSIVVKKWLKPMLLFDAADSFVIFRNVSLWEIETQDVCLNIADCQKGIPGYAFSWQDLPYFWFQYPNVWDYFVSLTLTDKYANAANKKWKLSLGNTVPTEVSTGSIDLLSGALGSWTVLQTWQTWQEQVWNLPAQSFALTLTGDFTFLSIPEASVDQNGAIDLFVGKNLHNSILYYIKYDAQWEKDCYIDLDVTDTIEKDFYCNQLYFKVYDAKFKDVQGRIYYQLGSKLISKDFTVHFLDFAINLDARLQKIYDTLSTLIDSLDATKVENSSLKDLLTNLKNNIIDDSITTSNVLDIQTYLSGNTNFTLSDQQTTDLQWVLKELLNQTIVSAQGGNVYEQAKTEILLAIPETLRTEVEGLFTQFETVESDPKLALSQQDQRKQILNQIVALLGAKVVTLADGQTLDSDQIDSTVMQGVILPKMCEIMQFYSIPSDRCVSDTLKTVPQATTANVSPGMATWLKVGLWIFGVVLWVFLVLVVIFAVRARISKSEDDQDEDTNA